MTDTTNNTDSRMNLYNRLEDFLFELESADKRFILENKFANLVYTEACDLSNHFGEIKDNERIENKIKRFEDQIQRLLRAFARSEMIYNDKAKFKKWLEEA